MPAVSPGFPSRPACRGRCPHPPAGPRGHRVRWRRGASGGSRAPSTCPPRATVESGPMIRRPDHPDHLRPLRGTDPDALYGVDNLTVSACGDVLVAEDGDRCASWPCFPAEAAARSDRGSGRLRDHGARLRPIGDASVLQQPACDGTAGRHHLRDHGALSPPWTTTRPAEIRPQTPEVQAMPAGPAMPRSRRM